MLLRAGESGFIDALQEGLTLFLREAILTLVSNRLVLTIVGTLDRSPFDLTGLTSDGGTLLGLVVFGHRLRTHLI